MDINKIHRQLALDALDLLVGETTRKIPCPFCGKAEGGFVVTRIDEGLLYNCFHAKCDGGHGIIASNNHGSVSPPAKPKERPKFTDETIDLSVTQMAKLFEKYHIHKSVISGERWSWCPERHRVVMPIFNEQRKKIGVTLRWFNELSDVIPFDVQQKNMTYWEDEESPHIHFPLVEKSRCFDSQGTPIYVIVEDIPSAISVQVMGVPCIALLGTNIPKQSLSWFYGKNVIFALDPDATAVALRYQKQYNILFKSCRVLHLSKDPKDMMGEEIIQEIIQNIKM